jgi:hypothetical protein
MLLSQDLLMSYIKSQVSLCGAANVMCIEVSRWNCYWDGSDALNAELAPHMAPELHARLVCLAGSVKSAHSMLPACLPARPPARLPACMLQRALPRVAGEESLQHSNSSGVDAQPWELSFDELQNGEPIGEGSFGRVRLQFPPIEQAENSTHCQEETSAGTVRQGSAELSADPLRAAVQSLQVYLARWHETPVAVKVLIDKDAMANAGSKEALSLTDSSLAKLDEVSTGVLAGSVVMLRCAAVARRLTLMC